MTVDDLIHRLRDVPVEVIEDAQDLCPALDGIAPIVLIEFLEKVLDRAGVPKE